MLAPRRGQRFTSQQLLHVVFLLFLLSAAVVTRGDTCDDTSIANETGWEIPNRFAPRCIDSTTWERVQCSLDRSWCWCVTDDGRLVAHTLDKMSSSEDYPPGRCERRDSAYRGIAPATVVLLVIGMFVVSIAITGYCIVKRSRVQAVYMNAMLAQDDDGDSTHADGTSHHNDSVSAKEPPGGVWPRPPPTPPIPRMQGATLSGADPEGGGADGYPGRGMATPPACPLLPPGDPVQRESGVGGVRRELSLHLD